MRLDTFLIIATAVTFTVAGSAFGHEPIEDHATLEGPFETPMKVTIACLECHENAAAQVMATSHWTWELEQKRQGADSLKRGKKNVINNFCIAIQGNWPRCTSCHVGYGWKDDSFDFTDESRVDCLVCHDTTGTYKKPGPGAGMPAGFTGNQQLDKKPVDLGNIARNVGMPSRANCLTCHALGGGGDGVKHGDIDMTLKDPDSDLDIHMAVGTNNFLCQDCHLTKGHNISGNGLMASSAVETSIGCTECHDELPHNASSKKNLLNNHTSRIACQTCHIPIFAKKHATVMSWDWSKAKNPKKLPENKRIFKENGHKVYVFMKGQFTYGSNVVPTYSWYDGTAGGYNVGDEIDPQIRTKLNYPLGSKDDPQSKIYPFKVHTGKQVYDVQLNHFLIPKLFPSGADKEEAFWKSFDWDRAVRAGKKYSKVPYSGKLGFASTSTWWPINHMVSPASEALKCMNCHGSQGRLNWQELGYADDPRVLNKKQRLKKRMELKQKNQAESS